MSVLDVVQKRRTEVGRLCLQVFVEGHDGHLAVDRLIVVLEEAGGGAFQLVQDAVDLVLRRVLGHIQQTNKTSREADEFNT